MTPALAVPTSVSCLVVTRPGRLKRLEDALRCFAAQTHPACELVVVHDGVWDVGRCEEEHDRWVARRP